MVYTRAQYYTVIHEGGIIVNAMTYTYLGAMKLCTQKPSHDSMCDSL